MDSFQWKNSRKKKFKTIKSQTKLFYAILLYVLSSFRMKNQVDKEENL
jgi:hypothetical protein